MRKSYKRHIANTFSIGLMNFNSYRPNLTACSQTGEECSCCNRCGTGHWRRLTISLDRPTSSLLLYIRPRKPSQLLRLL